MRLPEWMQRAIWEGDTNTLNERAGCVCCCHEHTFESCPARAWEGCRGSGAPTRDDEAWAKHYEKFHGMSRNKFYGDES